MTKPKPRRKAIPMRSEETPALVAELRRQLAEEDFHEFVCQAWHVVEPDRPFQDNWHIQGICTHLEAVTTGTILQLLINVPPGTMKSLLVCVLWPAWVWIKSPVKRFMFASYSKSFTMRDSVRCRKLIESEWYQERWPLAFSEDQNTKGLYENERGGWRLATSVEGEGTGLHPDFIGVDDPHKVKEAESDADRNAVIEWWDGTMTTRGVTRGVRRVCIMQRIHAADLSGHLESKGNWVHVCLPMRYETPAEVEKNGVKVMVPRMKQTPIGWNDPRKVEGELLWPALFSPETVADLEINLGLYHAAGQLQQRPTPRGGGMFRVEWFEVIPACPSCIKLVRYWDKAGTKGGTGAETSGTLMGLYNDPGASLPALKQKYVIIDIRTERVSAAERETIIKQTAEMDRMYGYVETWVEQEPGSGGKESAESTVGNLAGFTCNIERVTGSKQVRAEPLASQASVGKVKVLTGRWTQPFLDEVSMFPLGKLKDMIDSTSGAFNKLCVATGAFGSTTGIYTGQRDVTGGERMVSDRLGRGDM